MKGSEQDGSDGDVRLGFLGVSGSIVGLILIFSGILSWLYNHFSSSDDKLSVAGGPTEKFITQVILFIIVMGFVALIGFTASFFIRKRGDS